MDNRELNKYLFSGIREPKNGTFSLKKFKSDAERLEAEMKKTYLGKKEVIALNGKAFGQGSWGCVTGTYRTMFITSVLFAGFDYEKDIVSKMVAITVITAVFEFLIYPIAGMLVARTNTRIGRYRPFGLLISIPISAAGAMMFISPPGFDLQQKIIYIIIVTCLFNFLNIFLNLAYNLVQVNTPNSKERGKWIAFAGIVQTVGSVVPMVLFKVLAYFLPEASIFTILGVLFAAILLFTNLAFFIYCKERVVYSPQKIRIATGLLKPFKYKPFVLLQIANQVRTFAGLTGVTTPFLAAVVLGTENAILFSLPTGVGTVIGLLLCNLMLRKIKPLYMMRGIGIYSAIVAAAATVVGPFAGIPF
jgi:Na+/melibiose symporter-like transporter